MDSNKLTLHFNAPKKVLRSLLSNLEDEAAELGLEVRHGSYPEVFVTDEEVEECVKNGNDPRILGADKLVVIVGSVVVIYEDPFIASDKTIGVWIEVPLDK